MISFRLSISHPASCSIRYPRMMKLYPFTSYSCKYSSDFQIDTGMPTRKTLELLPQSDSYHMPGRQRRIPADLQDAIAIVEILPE